MKLQAFKTKGLSLAQMTAGRGRRWRVACVDVLRVSREGLAATRSDRPCDLSEQLQSYSRSR